MKLNLSEETQLRHINTRELHTCTAPQRRRILNKMEDLGIDTSEAERYNCIMVNRNEMDGTTYWGRIFYFVQHPLTLFARVTKGHITRF